jgi:hypothetical protein
MKSDSGTKPSGRAVPHKDGGDSVVFSKAEMKEFVRVAGKPWHHRRKKISLKRVKALRALGFSIKQVARIYRTSETTIRRRLKGE